MPRRHLDAPGSSVDRVGRTEGTTKAAPAVGGRIYLDPHEPQNAFAHGMMRPVLRRVALSYHLRCQVYLWIYFAGALGALLVLNVLLWYPLRHRYLSAALIAVVALQCGLNIAIVFPPRNGRTTSCRCTGRAYSASASPSSGRFQQGPWIRRGQ